MLWGVLRIRKTRYTFAELANDAVPVEPLDPETIRRIDACCSDCMGLPRPDEYPRNDWYAMVRNGYNYYAASGRTDLDPPEPRQTEVYYRQQARELPTFSPPEEADTKLKAKFTVQKMDCAEDVMVAPAVSGLRWMRLQPEEPPVLVVSDMRAGTVFTIRLDDRSLDVRRLAHLHQPCRVEPCDLDGDHLVDLVVADLGSFYPFDHNHGRVVWLRQVPGGEYEETVIAENLGRVADVRCVDIEGDGDLDCIVAEFGARRSGNILLLRNVTTKSGPVRLELERIDPRPGTINVPIFDLDGDKRPDFVALVSQEYEMIDAFINQGKGKFRRTTLWAGPGPSYGSSGIELVDMDRDGDIDILYTNGDMFDDSFLKPSHGVQWLENQGELRFAHHRLTDLPGAYGARAGDIDQDGDDDIIAVVFVKPDLKPSNMPRLLPHRLASVICLEQTSPGKFSRHTLETGLPYHAGLELADFDGDGDLDFAVGMLAINPNQQFPHWLSIWWNQPDKDEVSIQTSQSVTSQLRVVR